MRESVQHARTEVSAAWLRYLIKESDEIEYS